MSNQQKIIILLLIAVVLLLALIFVFNLIACYNGKIDSIDSVSIIQSVNVSKAKSDMVVNEKQKSIDDVVMIALDDTININTNTKLNNRLLVSYSTEAHDLTN